MKPNPVPWWVGLLPPAGMLVQMVVFFGFGNEKLMQKDWPWIAFLLLQFLATFYLVIRIMRRFLPPPTPRSVRFQRLCWVWVLFWQAAYQYLNFSHPKVSSLAFKNMEDAYRLQTDMAFYETKVAMLVMLMGLLGIGMMAFAFHIPDDAPQAPTGDLAPEL